MLVVELSFRILLKTNFIASVGFVFFLMVFSYFSMPCFIDARCKLDL